MSLWRQPKSDEEYTFRKALDEEYYEMSADLGIFFRTPTLYSNIILYR